MAKQRLSVLCLVLAAGLGCLTAGAREGPAPGSLQVGDEAGKLVPLPAKEWAKLRREKVEVKAKGGEAVTYEGVPLAEVLRFAGVSFDKHPRGRAASYVLVEGSDGYRAVLALAEVDPKVTDRAVLLADRLDGKPLPEGVGPFRLIVPGDKVPSRWVKQVVRVGVHHHPDAEAGKN
jgi:DMSO/TMAO reductase YedYZ molybdopterin-dependent catalytic subunit